MTFGPSPALLLHGEGWDELIMVVVGLILAFVIISMTGRRPASDDRETHEEEVTADEGHEGRP